MFEGVIGLWLLAAAVLPLALFDFAFLHGLSSLAALCALVGGLAIWGRGFALGARLNGLTLTLCCLIAALLCLLGGEMHVFSPTSDWIVRDAVLRDLVVAPWPAHYDLDGQDFLLRAPLGMYLVPAAIGKIFGLVAAHYALFLQNTSIFAGLLILFTARSKTWRERGLILGTFVLFSGLDGLPWAKAWLFGEPVPFEWHLETWVAFLQYSSHITQLFWVPHHAFAGWGFIAAYLYWRNGRLTALSLGSVFVLCLFWSPLAMMGALPFLAFALISDWRRGQFHPRDVIVPLLIGTSALPVVAYMTFNGGAVSHGFLFTEEGFPRRYAEFILVELALWFWIFYVTSRRDEESLQTSDLLIAGISLLLFPLYSIGAANDFTMRASIPALALVALAAAPRVGYMLKVSGGRRIVLIAGLLVAAATPSVEIIRALIMPATALADCSYVAATKAWMRAMGENSVSTTNYLAVDTGPIAGLLTEPKQHIDGEVPCGADIPILPFLHRDAAPSAP